MLNKPLIELNSLKKSYKNAQNHVMALNDVTLSIKAGEFIAITGASGSGKSTMLNVLGLLDDYDSGEYILDNRPTTNLSDKELAWLRNRKFGFVFQAFNLLPQRNALENVALPLFYQNTSHRERSKQAAKYLEIMGLSDRADHLPDEMSGGQKQRVAIARALVTNPSIILADEPTGALDTKTSEEIMNIFTEINQQGKTILLVTHDKEVATYANRIISLVDGELFSDEPSLSITNE